jgi:hypothetical protein
MTIAARLSLVAAAMLLTALAPPPTLDWAAERYVKLSLEAGEREPEYVDAYYGPAEWAAAAKANPRDLPTLLKDARALKAEVAAIPPMSLTPDERRRRASLLGQLTAAETRLAMANGQKFSFADEARGLFGTAPDLKPLAAYDPVLAQIDRLVPGPGPLDDRVSRYRESLRIPPDKLRPVMDAAIAECRRRTMAHIPLPKDETFALSFVTGKPWSGYNYYKGKSHSLIEVNTDLPVLVDRAIDLGCHEGYPGHHVLNLLLEEKLSNGKGWTEFTVYPLYSPQSLLAEGSANYGIELAFPDNEQAKFEAEVLFPLAGLDPKEAPRLASLNKASRALAGSRFTIARDYLDGRISREEAIALSQKYGLQSRARSEKAIAFADHYRSYVINYGHGRDLVRTTVEAAGPGQDARWARMEQLLSEPTTPADLGVR